MLNNSNRIQKRISEMNAIEVYLRENPDDEQERINYQILMDGWEDVTSSPYIPYADVD